MSTATCTPRATTPSEAYTLGRADGASRYNDTQPEAAAELLPPYLVMRGALCYFQRQHPKMGAGRVQDLAQAYVQGYFAEVADCIRETEDEADANANTTDAQ